MEFRFPDEKLQALYTEGKGSEDYPTGLADVFVRRIRTVEGASDERDLRALGSLHFEKLKGKKYKGKYSIRLKGQWRLILRLVKSKARTVVEIDEITNHYGD